MSKDKLSSTSKHNSSRFDQKHNTDYAIVAYYANDKDYNHYFNAFTDGCYFNTTASQQLALLLSTGKKHVVLNESDNPDELLPIAEFLQKKYKIQTAVVDLHEFLSQFDQ